jgi:hypothetical protein
MQLNNEGGQQRQVGESVANATVLLAYCWHTDADPVALVFLRGLAFTASG